MGSVILLEALVVGMVCALALSVFSWKVTADGPSVQSQRQWRSLLGLFVIFFFSASILYAGVRWLWANFLQ